VNQLAVAKRTLVLLNHLAVQNQLAVAKLPPAANQLVVAKHRLAVNQHVVAKHLRVTPAVTPVPRRVVAADCCRSSSVARDAADAAAAATAAIAAVSQLAVANLLLAANQPAVANRLAANQLVVAKLLLATAAAIRVPRRSTPAFLTNCLAISAARRVAAVSRLVAAKPLAVPNQLAVAKLLAVAVVEVRCPPLLPPWKPLRCRHRSSIRVLK
jgi:hypothetical protein